MSLIRFWADSRRGVYRLMVRYGGLPDNDPVADAALQEKTARGRMVLTKETNEGWPSLGDVGWVRLSSSLAFMV